MRIAPTVREGPLEAVALALVVAVATTVQGLHDGEKGMTTSRMGVIHDLAMAIVRPMVVASLIATVHDLVLQKAEASPQRSAIRTKS